MTIGVKPNITRYYAFSPFFLLPTATSQTLSLSLTLALALSPALALP